jgi:hypothetical protein
LLTKLQIQQRTDPSITAAQRRFCRFQRTLFVFANFSPKPPDLAFCTNEYLLANGLNAEQPMSRVQQKKRVCLRVDTCWSEPFPALLSKHIDNLYTDCLPGGCWPNNRRSERFGPERMSVWDNGFRRWQALANPRQTVAARQKTRSAAFSIRKPTLKDQVKALWAKAFQCRRRSANRVERSLYSERQRPLADGPRPTQTDH